MMNHGDRFQLTISNLAFSHCLTLKMKYDDIKPTLKLYYCLCFSLLCPSFQLSCMSGMQHVCFRSVLRFILEKS